MIVELSTEIPRSVVNDFKENIAHLGVFEVPYRHSHGCRILTMPSSVKETDIGPLPKGCKLIPLSTDAQLSSREWRAENTSVRLDDTLAFGDETTVFMAGPCAVEDRNQIFRIAEHLVKTHDIKIFRAGSYKPRTSPYSFQGLGEEGLRLLDDVRREFGVKIITEVKDETHVKSVADVADVIQIGTKAMYNPALLRSCGAISKPVLLKRAFMATLQEFLQAADFIMQQGNLDVILCERGLRNFEPQTRFSLDLCGAAILRERSHLPIVLDPSHAMGKRSGVPLLMQACAGFGADGLLVETHYNPDKSWSDAAQALHFEQLAAVYPIVKKICAVVGRSLV